MGSKTVSHSVNGYYASAKITWGESPEVTVTIISANTGWRITGKYSEGDMREYLSGSASVQTKTFSSSDNKNYVFGIYDPVEETFCNGENSEFTVSFSSGNGSSGGGSGDSGGGSFDNGRSVLHIEQTEGAVIQVERIYSECDDYSYKNGDYRVFLPLGDNGVYYSGDKFSITAYALDGYEINYYSDMYLVDGIFPFYVSGLEFVDGAFMFQNSSEATVGATAIPITIETPTSTIHICDNGVYSEYQCYIDTKYTTYPSYLCEIIGHTNSYSLDEFSGIYSPQYNRDNAKWGNIGSEGIYTYHTYYMKFKTPNIIDSINSVIFYVNILGGHYYVNTLTGVYEDSGTTKELHYALCTSDSNYKLYHETTKDVLDDNQIASGTFCVAALQGSVGIIEIDSISLNSDTEYYLIVWGTDKEYPLVYVDEVDNHIALAVNKSEDNIIIMSKFESYTPYIDTGKTWEPL